MRRLLALVLVVAACSGGGGSRVVLGAGTTLVDSGFMDALASDYESASGGRVAVLGESSQRLFDLARRGEADIVVTHEPAGLAQFVAEGRAASSTEVLRSRFVLLGPPDLAATVTTSDPAVVFAELAQRGLPFVSRSDGSGTFIQEQAFWALAGIDPSSGAWYETTGQGMGLTLQVADQRRAFIVAEEGTWLEAQSQLDLVEVPLDGDWPNIYSVTVVEGASPGSQAFADWLSSDDGRQAIERVNHELFGSVVYAPIP